MVKSEPVDLDRQTAARAARIYVDGGPGHLLVNKQQLAPAFIQAWTGQKNTYKWLEEMK